MTALLTPTARSNTRRQVVVGLSTLTVVAWAYLAFIGVHMTEMGSPFAMPMTSSWTGRDAGLMWVMWAVMMAAMMLPSALPMVSTYARTLNPANVDLQGSTSLFVGGYLLAWSGFAAVATGGQWLFHDLALVTPMGVSTSGWLGGLLLLVAGCYQFTTLKESCLRQCQSPLSFLLQHWRSGRAGAFRLGLRHGTVCVGCCWALMTLLFVLGVMNLVWVAVVAAVVLLEKLVPRAFISHVLGIGLLLWGSALLVGAVA